MSTSELFREFLINLAIDNADQISLRYGEITACLNKEFRDTESKTANSLQVGSYGRWTAIKGISDLDMLYIMPSSKWDVYKDGKQSKLLTDVKDIISNRYPKTNIFVDRLVVRVLYNDFHIEVQPVFEQPEGDFKYPDTYSGGSWKITKPRDEIKAMSEFNSQKNSNLRRLCKMVRAWKNCHGINMGGLLIDTLAYNFLKSTSDYNEKSFLYYDEMSRDFFKYLADQPDQEFYAAIGSGQRVRVKRKFQKKSKETHELCLDAIQSVGNRNENDKWKKVYGRSFPGKKSIEEDIDARTWDDTEEFIEDRYSIDIKYNLRIDCEVTQNGFRINRLSHFLRNKLRLQPRKRLEFQLINHNIEGTFKMIWKVLNRGPIAEMRNEIRGQLLDDNGSQKRVENTKFTGEHLVECYAIQNGVVVARGSILVPIQGDNE